MKAIVICLLSFVLVSAASAQGLLRNRSGLTRPSAATPSASTSPSPSTSSSSDTATSAGGRAIEFSDDTPVSMYLMVYGELVGKTVLPDPQIPKVSFGLHPQKDQKLTEEDKIEAIETVLEMNGVHLEPYGEKFVRALPRKDVRKDGIPLIMDPEAQLNESTRVVSFMIQFKNIAIDEAQKALEGFKSASGILLVFERTNSILVTDTEQIINRMREIAKAIDIASPVTETVEYIQIKYANANEVKQVIDNIVQESMKEQEKNGKQPQNGGNNSVAVPTARPLLGGLRRPGQQQPAEPVNNMSLVTTVSDADRGMIRGKVVTIADERSNKILIITNAQNMKFFKQVIEALDVETTPDVQVKVYRLKYAEAEDVSDMINDLIGNSSSSKSSGKNNQNQAAKTGTSGSVTRGTSQAKKPANQRSGESKAGELNKDNVTVLADKRINGLVVMARTEDIPTIEQIIESMDIKLSQVLIETCIIEVTLGDGLNTGVDWVLNGRDKTGDELEKGNMVNGDRAFASMLGGGGGGGKALLEGVMSVASNAVGSAHDFMGTANPIGGGINYIFKSEALNLAAVVSASKTDSRSKYIASPVIMTLDNKEAVIEATDARQFLSGWQAVSGSYAGSGLPSPNYSAKDIGIKLKITPKINPNGTVMLQVEEEYSQAVQTQSMMTPVDNHYEQQQVDVPSTRTMQSDVLLENGQTVVFGGLTETTTTDKENGIPILKDIPIVGKWLFGKVEKKEDRKELLVFMTPYVLDDAQAAQAEALRRKKTISDPRPWDDHGWSASALADPVSKQEQMRRIKDEWRVQDEERRTRIAIEKEKVNRVKKLQEMSKDEREMWLKMHKAELDAEAQDELEEKMLDDESQDMLKQLAAEIRAKKLGEAEKALKTAEDEVAAENERGKLDAAKKAKTEGEAAKGQE